MKTIYEIKRTNKWEYILASSIKDLDNFVKKNNFSGWRCPGMLSQHEISTIRKTASEI